MYNGNFFLNEETNEDVERDRDKTLKPFAELLNTGKSLLWLLKYISEASFPDHTDNNK